VVETGAMLVEGLVGALRIRAYAEELSSVEEEDRVVEAAALTVVGTVLRSAGSS
jgi:hypothetical protein